MPSIYIGRNPSDLGKLNLRKSSQHRRSGFNASLEHNY